MTRLLVRIGSVAGAIVAIGGLWIAIGGPMPATSSDIRRLDRAQAEIAIDTYQNKLNNLLVFSPADNTPARKAWEEELNRARDQIKRAEDRKIELSK